ncbi:unnamed protein product [Trichobilharzia szidati]|nr:unnamed protein product [Trichobilharzia szidati]
MSKEHMEVFMDHSNRTTNPVNHQTKKERSVHGKPEWQKSAIRTCGLWSEQLSSKGKIYFYNCATEVSQWQKPPEWNLPELNRKDLVKLMNERQQSEGIILKRSHESSESEVASLKDDRSLLSSDCKRAKLSFNSEVRRPGSSQVDTNLVNHTNDTGYSSGVLHGDGRNNVSRPIAQDPRYDTLKKNKIHLPPRTSTNDDMEISPNSSPLSDGSSTKYSADKKTSPQKPAVGNSSPNTFCFQRPRDCKMKGTETNSGHAVQKQENSTLYQLVDAIRASIGGILEPPPPTSARVAHKLSPSNNGSIFGSNRAPVPLENSQPSSCQLSPSKGSQQSQLDDRLRQPCSVSISSSCKQSKCDSPIVYPGLTESRNYNVHKSSVQSANHCSVSSVKTNTMDESRQIVSSNNSPLIPYPASSQTESRSLPYASYSACRNTSHQNSPSVIPSPHTSQTTASTSSTSLQTCVSLSHYDLSSRQVNKIIEILAEQAHCKTTTKEPNCSSDLSINSNKLHDDLKAATSPVNSARSFISRTLQNEYALNRDPINVNARSQHSQLNELVQVLRAALHHHTSSHSASDSTSFVSGNDIQNSGSRSDSLVHQDTNKSHNLDFKGQESRGAMSTSHQDSSFPVQSGSRTHVTSRLAADSYPFGRINTGLDASGSPVSACNFSNISNSAKTTEAASDVTDKRETPNLQSPISASPSIRSNNSINTAVDVANKPMLSPAPPSENSSGFSKVSDPLDSTEMKSFFDPVLISNYHDESLQRLEQEAQIESKNFDRLQSVLYGELSAESKKLRALVRISEAKLAIHKEKQTSLQELMDAIEVRKHLPNLSFVDDVL